MKIFHHALWIMGLWGWSSLEAADYFLDDETQVNYLNSAQRPSYNWGLGERLSWATGGSDHWLTILGEKRIADTHRLGLTLASMWTLDGFSLEANWLWNTRGHIRRESFEESLVFGLGGLVRDVAWDPASPDSKEWIYNTMFSLGYGRDMELWKRSPLGLRIQMFCKVVLGRALAREGTNAFGMPEVTTGHTLIGASIALLWLRGGS